MDDLECIAQELSAILKKKGYRKNRMTWYKEKPLLTVVLSIEKSLYSKDTWYYWFGICLHDIAETKSRSIGNCHVKYRVENTMDHISLSQEMVVNLLNRWESMYGDIQTLRYHAIQGKLPLMSTIDAKKYLSSIDLSKYGKTGDGSLS